MAEKESTGVDASAPPEPSTVAVGLVARPDTADAVVREVVRARRRGYEPLVAVSSECPAETAETVRAAGATVLPTGDDDPTDATLRDTLVAHARANSFDAILVSETGRQRIDYDRTARALDGGEFAVTAPTVGETTTPYVVVGIPAYDEGATIASVVEGAAVHADTVVVVDDGSTDDTVQRAREAGAEVVEHGRNRGYGAALTTLFEEADRLNADILVVIDGDGQHDPDDIPRLVDRQRETNAEVVIGSRFVDGGSTDASLVRRAGLWTVNQLMNLSLGIVRSKSRIHDTQSGFRAYDATAVETLADEAGIDHRMSASVDILYHATRREYRIEEVPTSVTYDVADASTHHPVTHGYTLVKNIVRTVETERPLSAIGLPGVLSTAIGVGFAYWTMTNYVSSGSFPYGLAITSTFFTLAGVFATFTAILLHSLNLHMGR